MRRPFRRYCFYLSERLGYSSPEELYTKLNNNQIYEWMAFDKTNDNQWVEEFNKQEELEQSNSLPADVRAEMIKRALGG